MNWWSTLLQLLYAIFLFGLVLGLAYLSTRFIGSRLGGLHVRGRHLRMIEQVVVGRDRSLILIEVAGKVYLVGSTAESIRLLTTIKDPETIEAMLEVPEQPPPLDLAIIPGALRRMPASFRTLMDRLRPSTPSPGDAEPSNDAANNRIREHIDRLRRLTKQ